MESTKVNFSWNFRRFAKEVVLLLCLWSTLYVAISKCIVSWFQFFYFNWLQLIQRESAKVTFSWNFRCSTKEAVLLLRLWSTVYIVFSKCKLSWFYLSYFTLTLLTESAYVKVICSWNLRSSVKEAALLFISWSTLYVAILKCIVSWF